MKLVKPSIQYENSYRTALAEAQNEGGETTMKSPAPHQSFAEFVQELSDEADGKNLPDGYVPATTFWVVDEDNVLGRIQIRHELNEYLEKFGGHIGYYIRPTARRKGYGIKALSAVLEYAKEFGLHKVLLTCDEDSIGSQKIIERCGGILDNVVEVDRDSPRKKRYWISL